MTHAVLRAPRRTGLAVGVGLSLCGLLAACGGGAGSPGDGGDASSSTPRLQASAGAARPGPPTTGPIARVPPPAAFASRPAAASEAAPDPLAELRREVAQLRADVEALRRSGGAPQAAAPDPRRDPAARRAAEEARLAQGVAAESRFRDETVDPQWSRDTQQLVQTLLAQADPMFLQRVRGLECRAQSCRLELAPAEDPLAEAELPLKLLALGALLPNSTAGLAPAGEGPPGTVLYLSR